MKPRLTLSTTTLISGDKYQFRLIVQRGFCGLNFASSTRYLRTSLVDVAAMSFLSESHTLIFCNFDSGIVQSDCTARPDNSTFCCSISSFLTVSISFFVRYFESLISFSTEGFSIKNSMKNFFILSVSLGDT